MHPLVRAQIPQIIEACKRHRVKRLALFGSAVRDDFDPERSDIDVLIDFEPLAPGTHADHFFGLLADLEARMGRPVDLVESHTLRNKFVRRAVERDEVVL
jgi:predicted nucleotidyltransferase